MIGKLTFDLARVLWRDDYRAILANDGSYVAPKPHPSLIVRGENHPTHPKGRQCRPNRSRRATPWDM